MPIPLAVLIPALISGAVGGTELGLNAAGVGQPDTGKLEKQQEDQAKADAAKAAAQDAATKAQLIRRAAPDAQAATGGSLTEAPFASLTSSIAGLPGSVEDAIRLLGSGGGETQGLAFSGGGS